MWAVKLFALVSAAVALVLQPSCGFPALDGDEGPTTASVRDRAASATAVSTAKTKLGGTNSFIDN